MSYFYLFPILIALVLILSNVFFSQKLRYERRFTNSFSNRLHALSYVKPFVWFVNEKEEDPRVAKIEKMIQRANLQHIANYRILTTFQAFLMLMAVTLSIFFFFTIDEWIRLSNFIFRINGEVMPVGIEMKILLGIVLLSIPFVPKWYVMYQAKQNEHLFIQELPILQLSITLMLRAKRPMSEILYTLGHSNTRYRPIFQKAHRIYLRDKESCWAYLYPYFRHTGFENTLDVLKGTEHYSREETIRVIENGLEHLTQASSDGKQKVATLGNLFSQFSMAIPFAGVLLLGALPFAMYILQMMEEGLFF